MMHTHRYTHRYTQIHTDTHTDTHRYTRTDTHTQTHTHRYTQTHTDTHTDTHRYTRTDTRTDTHTQIHTDIHTHKSAKTLVKNAYIQTFDIVLHLSLVQFIDQIGFGRLVLLKLALQGIKENTTKLLDVMLLPGYRG